MQLFLDTAALLLNVFMTRRLGTSAMGVVTLTGTFLALAGTVAGGNAFLCTSRLISEEFGKRDSSPEKVLAHGIKLCLFLSACTSAVTAAFAGTLSRRFFGGADLTGCIRLMPAALITGAVSACLKGYFNACRKSAVTAAGEILEFAVRCTVIVLMTLSAGTPDSGEVCGIMIAAIISGNAAVLCFLAAVYFRRRPRRGGKCSLTFRGYTALALPIMGGGILTAVLGSANDALIPVCLRQYGDSAGRALSLFGIFEGMVLPALFFPSVILCSMSGIIVSETARAAAAGNTARIRGFSARLTEWTMTYAIFAAAVLMRFGGVIGEMLGGGELAGVMITAVAPVVPFIYMEIVLEAMIKGMGLQAFSSLNYLGEYAVRISVVLVAVPRFGFWGIAASYYASNVLGNCLRFAKLSRTAGLPFSPFRFLMMPAAYAFMTMKTAELAVSAASGGISGVPRAVVMLVLWGVAYWALMIYMKRRDIPQGMESDRRTCIIATGNSLKFVSDAQKSPC
ncbi:MAG: polysaccharide biosynthesis C-terminal domain-containing protein [Ruminococcus sp.]|nr:polysaccharide biosynthesis C-terminal domain-containing protein [Ruminococcus sp.]